jgi:hypothetical protein
MTNEKIKKNVTHVQRALYVKVSAVERYSYYDRSMVRATSKTLRRRSSPKALEEHGSAGNCHIWLISQISL